MLGPDATAPEAERIVAELKAVRESSDEAAATAARVEELVTDIAATVAGLLERFEPLLAEGERRMATRDRFTPGRRRRDQG